MSSDILVPAVLTLPSGLVGLPTVHVVDSLPVAGGQFVELIARDEPTLGWLAASADDVRPGMTATLRATGRLEDDEVLLVLLSSHGDPAVVTANLLGPLAVGPDGTTRQLVLDGPPPDVRARVGRLGEGAAEPHEQP
jgi:hypothetical protein